MTILPLVGRELLVRARSPAGYWMRFGAALAGILFCVPALMMAQGSTTARAQMGAFAFQGLVVTAFILCCFAGFLTVDGISRERREGTLGLLFLTRVRALDVLLGNFGAAGIASLCALIAFVPVLIVPVLAGGVTGGEATRKVLVLFDTMILSLAAGLWASSRGRGWLSSGRSAAGMLALVIFGPLLLAWVFPPVSRLGFLRPGPLSALKAADDSLYRRNVAPYWISIAVVHAISWLLVIWAGLRFRRALRQVDETPANPAAIAPRREPFALGQAPLEWLMRRQPGVRGFVWLAAILETIYQGLPLGGIMRRGWIPFSFWGSGLAFSVVEGCLFAWAASRFFIEARRAGELELLLTTPEGARSMIASQWNWLKEVFRLPIVLLMLPSVLGVVIMMTLPYSPSFRLMGSSFWWIQILSQIVNGVNILAGTMALVWAAMWYGWSERSQGRAIVRTVILAKGAPYLITMLGSMALNGLLPKIIFYNGRFDPWLMMIRYVPYLFQWLFYLWLFRWARRRLAGELPQAELRSGLRFRSLAWLGYE